jgi:catechol 2,3-dioxygenase-like lactoylglutathione lyase family enzyme
MITGAHFLLYSKDAEADRAFFRDVLGFRYIDVGHGWLIFAMPPAEAAIHPTDREFSEGLAVHSPSAVLYLMVDDLNSYVELLKAKGVRYGRLEQASWGAKTIISLPGGGEIGLYQPRHPTAFHLNNK